jgi:hypothetical protein
MQFWQDLFHGCVHIGAFGHQLPLCEPAELLESGLGLIVAPTLIVTLVGLLTFIKSWVDFGSFSIRSGRRAVQGLQVATATVRRVSARNMAAAVALILVVLVIQALWIGLAYYVGNSIRLFIEGLMGTVDGPPRLDIRNIPALLQSDTYTKLTIAVSCVAAASSWVLRRGRIDRMIGLFSVPGYVWAFFGLVGGVLNTAYLALSMATDNRSDLDVSGLAYMFAFGVSGVLYVIATNLVLRAPESLRLPINDKG